MEDNTTNLNVEKTYTDPKTGKFVKGNPGGGRPVGSVSIVEGIKKKLLEIEPENKKTYLDLFLSRYFRKAIKDGDVGLIRDMINRIDGMPQQRTDITSGDKPIPILNAIHSNHSSQEADETTKED
jgi:hypothetical protein